MDRETKMLSDCSEGILHRPNSNATIKEQQADTIEATPPKIQERITNLVLLSGASERENCPDANFAIQKLHRQHGIFITGKFDLQINEPFERIKAAMDCLCTMILGLPNICVREPHLH
jgi:hypothetical protein